MVDIIHGMYVAPEPPIASSALPAHGMPPAGPTQGPVSDVYPGRFEALDALRGLAALAVVVHHVASVHIGGPAVMVFFVISGYCIAAAGASARRNSLGFRGFMWRRVRRIMPPYLLSIAFWAAYRLIKLNTGATNDLARPWTDWLQNLSLTQWLTLIQNPVPYPPHNPTLFVGAYWSLCYEEQFYIVMGLLVAVGGLSALVSRWAIVTLLAISLAWNMAFPSTVYGVFIEYWAPFAFGCLVYYRLCELPRIDSPASTPGTRLASRSIDALLVVAGLASAWFFARAGGFPPPRPDGSELRSVPGELMVAAVIAVVLLLVRRWDVPVSRNRCFKPFKMLGTITFSLYLTHQFNLLASKKVASVIVGAGQLDTLAGYIVRVGFLVVVGSVFWWFCERPFLNKPIQSPQQGA